MNAVFSWRCKCGLSIRVIGESEEANPTVKSAVRCPSCDDEQIIAASHVISVTPDQDEIGRTKE
jgi:hypothetical protein